MISPFFCVHPKMCYQNGRMVLLKNKADLKALWKAAVAVKKNVYPKMIKKWKADKKKKKLASILQGAINNSAYFQLRLNGGK